MSPKIRKTVRFERHQASTIEREAKARGISQSQVVREALDRSMAPGSIPRGGDCPAALDAVLRAARRRVDGSTRNP